MIKYFYKLFDELVKIGVKTYHFLLKAFQKDYWKHHHLITTLKDWKLSISWVDHKSYAREKEIYLNKLKTILTPENLVKKVFEECKRCYFVIFSFCIYCLLYCIEVYEVREVFLVICFGDF